MTSKNLFFKLLKEDFRRRLWVFILASVVFFGTFGVVFTMVLERWVDNYTENVLISDSFSYGLTQDISMLEDELGQTLAQGLAGDIVEFVALNPWLIIVACVGAVICGISGFSFLHSKKQVDFYHSLPLKRELLFAVRFLNGVLFFVIPYLISLLYVYLICGIFGAMSWKIVQAGTVGLVIHLMGFIVMYLVTILAVLLTGKLLLAFLGVSVLNLYAPALYGLIITLKEVFFITVYNNSLDFKDFILDMKYASPLSYYLAMYNNVYNAETMKTFWLELGTFVIVAAVLTVAGIWLYKKRMSETSETAMSFRISEPIIRILLAVPVGVLVGFLFFVIQNDYSDGSSAIVWMIFGSVLGAFLAHGFIESLFRGDIKKCLSHKWQMLATMGIAVLIPLSFFFDVYGYDSYLPKKNQVREMAMYSRDLRFGGSYYDGEARYVTAQEYALSMPVEDFEAIYELAEILSEHAKLTRKDTFRIGRVVTNQYVPNTEKGVYMTDFVIRYILKDGSEVTRRYEYNYWAVLDLLEQIYNNEEFKLSTSPVYAAQKNGYKVSFVECFSPLSEDAYRIRNNAEELARVYTEELLAMQFDDLGSVAGIGRIEFIYEGEWYSHSAILYPQMTRTIALLKECGYKVPTLENAENIQELNISYSAGTALANKDGTVMPEGVSSTKEYYDKDKEFHLRITDPEEIKACLPYLISRQYYREFGLFPLVEENCNVSITFRYGKEAELYTDEKWFYFLEGQIPEFLKERMKENLDE